MTPDDLLPTALSLPAEERAKLARQLLESLHQEQDQDAAEAWLDDIQPRAQEGEQASASSNDSQVAQAQIEDFRQGLDALDHELIALLAKRFVITEKIGKVKAASGLEAMDAEREQRQFERFQQLAETYELDPNVVRDVMTTVFEHVKQRHQALARGGG